jgi:hypothetical protein
VYIGKRHRSAEDEDATEHTRKSPRIQESRHNPESKVQPPPSRRSPRLQKIRDSKNQQRTERAGKQTTLSHKITKAHHVVGHEQPRAKRGFLSTARKCQSMSRMSSFTMLTSAAEQRRVPEDKDEGKPKPSLTNPEAQGSGQSPLSLSVIMLLIRVAKRRRSTEDVDISNREAKRPQYHDIREQACSTDEYIENWLSTSCRSRRISSDNETLLREVSDIMPRKTADVLPSPTTSSSKKSAKSAASVSDVDYRKNSLRYRNIYIEQERPPVELIRQATRIISRSRVSPELDDAAIQKLCDKSRKLQDESEGEIIRQLAPHIIPAMDEIPDPRLAGKTDQLWCNSVPVPLDPTILTNPLPLPRPKPDLAFGYSRQAFNKDQLTSIDLLDDKLGRSYAIPDQELRFPFLSIEFKSQAKNGNHYIATNQAAGAGAIALNGNLELIQRSSGAEGFDFNEPQFFSVTMDHEIARINVHWLSAPTDGGEYCFHVERLSRHFLDEANGLRAVIRAIKNILDYSSDARLRKLCEALDAHRERVILQRKTGAPEGHQGPVIQTEPQHELQKGGGISTSTSTKAVGDGAGQGES